MLLFSRRARGPLARFVPLLRRLRVERPLRAVYEAIHAYRNRPRLLVGLFALTVFVQALRVLAIWSAGEAVGVSLSPRPYYVMGPLLFLVLLVPFTINGLAVRESFFVSFLGGLGVDPTRRSPPASSSSWSRSRSRFPARSSSAGRILRRAARGRSGWGTPSHHPAAIVVGKIARVCAESGTTFRAARSPRADVSVVVVTYNALPWVERCLESVDGHEIVVVDHGSTDGTVAAVRERFPTVQLVEQENRGLAAGWNRGIRETSGDYVLVLNADAWATGDAVERWPRSPMRTRGLRSPGRGCATPTGVCSRRCAASRRRGASPPSTCSCASSRRTRAR